MKIFLTGATGFVGAQLIHNLSKDDHELYILYRDEARKNKLISSNPNARLHLIKGDITKSMLGLADNEIDALPSMDYCYHLAALVKFDEALREELFQINLEGTRHTLEVAERLHTKHFLYVSTAYTVGTEERAMEELHPVLTTTNNPYEESKIQAEHLVMNAPMKVSILRPAIIIGDSVTGAADSKFTLYGFMKALKVFKRKIDRAPLQNQYRLIGDDTGTSNLVPVDYVVKVLTRAIPNAEDRTIYHITNSHPPVNRDILHIIKKHLNFKQLVVVPDLEDKLSPDEETLNGFIRVFGPYFKRSVVFDDANTRQLLAKTDEAPLELTEKMLDHIIGVYFK